MKRVTTTALLTATLAGVASAQNTASSPTHRPAGSTLLGLTGVALLRRRR